MTEEFDPIELKNNCFSLAKTMDEDDERQVVWEAERKERGFDETELWNLNVTICKFCAPRIKAFRLEGVGCPVGMDREQWNGILDKMVDAMEIYAHSESEGKILDRADMERVRHGLDLFHEFFYAMWW